MRSLDELSAIAQAVSDIYVERFGIKRDAVWYLAKMTEELGEVQAAYLKANGQGRTSETPDALKRALEDEVADLLSMVLLFAKWQDIDVGAAVDRKWGKYLEPGYGPEHGSGGG